MLRKETQHFDTFEEEECLKKGFTFCLYYYLKVDKLHAGLLLNSQIYNNVWDIVKKFIKLYFKNARIEAEFWISES